MSGLELDLESGPDLHRSFISESQDTRDTVLKDVTVTRYRRDHDRNVDATPSEKLERVANMNVSSPGKRVVLVHSPETVATGPTVRYDSETRSST